MKSETQGYTKISIGMHWLIALMVPDHLLRGSLYGDHAYLPAKAKDILLA